MLDITFRTRTAARKWASDIARELGIGPFMIRREPDPKRQTFTGTSVVWVLEIPDNYRADVAQHFKYRQIINQ